MKKKAYVKNQIQVIKKTKARFLSIFCIVFLGAAFFAGLRHTASIMEVTMDQYLDKYEFNDLNYIATLGFSDEDVKAIKDIDEIDNIECGNRFDALITVGDNVKGAVVYTNESFKNKVNKVELINGKLPTKDNQCLLDKVYATRNNIKVGSTILLSNDNGEKEFTVVGIVNDSRFFSTIERGTNTLGDGTNEAFVEILTEGNESFALPDDLYDLRGETVFNEIRISLRNSEEYSIFSDEYISYVKGVNKEIKKVLNKRIDKVNDGLSGEAKRALAKGKKDYKNGVQEYNDGLAQYEDGVKQYESGLKKYQDGLAKYNDGYKQYQDGYKQYLSGKEQYDQGLAAYNSGLSKYNQGLSQYESALALYNQAKASFDQLYNEGKITDEIYAQGNLEFEKQKAKLDSQGAELKKAEIELSKSKAILDSSKIKLDVSKSKLDETMITLVVSKNQLDTTKATLDNTKNLLDTTKIELDNGKIELENAKQEIEDSKRVIAQIPTDKLISLTRDENASVLSYESACDSMRAIAVVFPLIFFLVAALVSLTTMTRMVEEQRVQNGTFIALGYDKKDVINQYLIYAFLATFIASVLGIIAGVYFFPSIIYFLYNKMLFNVGAPIKIIFNPFICVLTFIISVAITLLVTYMVTRQELSAMPASLLRPKAPKLGKRIVLERITFIWKRLSFNQKVTMRNIFRYKKRFFMSVIGIAGCAALIVTGFGIKNSVSTLADKQYGEIFSYDGMVVFDRNLSSDKLAEEKHNFEKLKGVKDSGSFYRKTITIAGSKDHYGTLEVFKNSKELSQYIQLEDYQTGQELKLNDKGVIISAKLSELLGVSAGDKITISIDEKDYKVKVTGVMLMYFQHHIYMSDSLYQELTYQTPVSNYVYFNMTNNANQKDIIEYCNQNENIDSLNNVQGLSQAFRDQMGSIDSVVIILITCAGALAFIVLYNLTNINIQERKSEIATIKVLGFYPHEVYDYVFRENMILSVIGAVVGLGIGKLLHRYIINTVEVEVAMFIRSVNLMSYVYAIIITLIFTYLIDFGMRKVLKNIDMVESLKSIE